MTNREKAQVVDALRHKYELNELLERLELSKSSYYYARQHHNRVERCQKIRDHVVDLFKASNSTYGYRRIHAALLSTYGTVSEKIVRRIMHEEHLKVVFVKMRAYSSYAGEVSPEVPNLVDHNFHADAPNQVILTDITEFRIPAGKVYLSPAIDCFDGMPIAWTIGTSPNASLVNAMLDSVISQLNPGEHPIIHSDRGCHYRWPEWIKKAEEAGLVRSMSKKGCCPDNAACEGFFGHMKVEMFYGRTWEDVTVEEFIRKMNDYLVWYRETRIKETLDYMSPMDYRKGKGYPISG